MHIYIYIYTEQENENIASPEARDYLKLLSYIYMMEILYIYTIKRALTQLVGKIVFYITTLHRRCLSYQLGEC